MYMVVTHARTRKRSRIRSLLSQDEACQQNTMLVTHDSSVTGADVTRLASCAACVFMSFERWRVKV